MFFPLAQLILELQHVELQMALEDLILPGMCMIERSFFLFRTNYPC